MNRLLIVSILLGVILLLDWYAFQAVKTLVAEASSSLQRWVRIIYISFTTLVIISLFVYNFGNPDGLGKHARTFLMSFIFMNVLAKLLLSVFMLVDDLQRGLRWLVARFSGPAERISEEEGISRSKFLATAGVVVAAVPIVSMSWGIISGAHDYRVRRIKLPVSGLPKAFHGLRIAQLSDVHSGSFWNRTAVKGGVEMLVQEKADIAFFTGDLVNNRATEMQEWGSIFSGVKAQSVLFSFFGNHDYGDYVQWKSSTAKQANLRDLANVHKNMNWKLLNNEHDILSIDGERLGIIGVENWSARGRFPKYGKLKQAMEGLEETAFNVLLSHDPSHWKAEVLTDYPEIDLTLSGHTHGMQFGVDIPGFKWSPVQYMYEEWAGLYQERQQYLYVNRGFGYLGYPGRVGILPEITVFTLEQA